MTEERPEGPRERRGQGRSWKNLKLERKKQTRARSTASQAERAGSVRAGRHRELKERAGGTRGRHDMLSTRGKRSGYTTSAERGTGRVRRERESGKIERRNELERESIHRGTHGGRAAARARSGASSAR